MLPQTITKVGRPMLWKDPEQLQSLIEEYYKECKEREVPITMAGLAVALYCDRGTLINYSRKDQFFSVIKRARELVNAKLEEHLMSGKPPIGAIFLGKNNFGYVDKQEVEHSGEMSITGIVSKLEGNRPALEHEIIEGEVVGNEDTETEEMA